MHRKKLWKQGVKTQFLVQQQEPRYLTGFATLYWYAEICIWKKFGNVVQSSAYIRAVLNRFADIIKANIFSQLLVVFDFH